MNEKLYLLLAQRCHFAGVAFETITDTNGVANFKFPFRAQ